MSEKDYVLGTDRQELLRLERQHELWEHTAREACSQAGFARATNILDLGCGPGFTSLSLLRNHPKAHVEAIDASAGFLAHLQQRADQEHPGRVKTHTSLLESMSLPRKDFDAAYSRWVLIFVPEYEKVIDRVAAHLKPGAPWVLEEYVAYETMALCPDVPIMGKVVDAIFRSWKDQGGDPSRGRVLPATLERKGFRVKHMTGHARIARPGEPLWDWPDGFYRNFIPRLVSNSYLSADDEREFFKQWDQTRNIPGAFFLAPTMMTIIAEKI